MLDKVLNKVKSLSNNGTFNKALNKFNSLNNKAKGSIYGGATGGILSAGASALNALHARRKAEEDIRKNSGIFGKIANTLDPNRVKRLARQKVSIGKRVAAGTLAGTTLGAATGYGIGALKDRENKANQEREKAYQEEVRKTQEARKLEAERQREEMAREAAEKRAKEDRTAARNEKIAWIKENEGKLTDEQRNLYEKARRKGMRKSEAIQWAHNNTKEAKAQKKAFDDLNRSEIKKSKELEKQKERQYKWAMKHLKYSQGVNFIMYRNDLVNFSKDLASLPKKALSAALKGHRNPFINSVVRNVEGQVVGAAAGKAIEALRAKSAAKKARETYSKGVLNRAKNLIDPNRVKKAEELARQDVKDKQIGKKLSGTLGLTGAVLGLNEGIIKRKVKEGAKKLKNGYRNLKTKKAGYKFVDDDTIEYV
jgi:hypothetical protein